VGNELDNRPNQIARLESTESVLALYQPHGRGGRHSSPGHAPRVSKHNRAYSFTTCQTTFSVIPSARAERRDDLIGT